MKSLILVPSQPSLHLSSIFSPWNPKIRNAHNITLPKEHRQKTTHRLRANAKGFGNAQPAATKKETPPTKSPNKKDDEDEEEIPQVVFERMLLRIGASVGLPMAVGFGSLKVFDVIKEMHLWDFPLWVPFLTTLVTFGTSALGIAYGALSTSWDAEKKGSILGFEEAQSNWVEIWREEDDNNDRNK